jgi:threonine/homoserine/homoserine lactone efflux protein
MSLIYPFLAGFVAASIGIALPGLINMTAAKVSLKDGKDRALMFVFGALLIILFQTLASVFFAKFLTANPDIIIKIKEIGLVIFMVLTFYFLVIAKQPNFQDRTIKSKKSRFFFGMLLSALNFFPIPYYVFVTITLSAYNLFSFQTKTLIGFLIGVLLGSFALFYCYISFFSKIESKTSFLIQNMNKIIGSITALVSILTLYKIITYYY